MRSFKYEETVLGLLCIIWAGWLLIFDAYHVSNILVALRNWQVPESLMIGWLLFCGGGLLILPSFWRRHIHFLMCAFWFFISFAIAETNITLTAIPVYIAVAILHAGCGILMDKSYS